MKPWSLGWPMSNPRTEEEVVINKHIELWQGKPPESGLFTTCLQQQFQKRDYRGEKRSNLIHGLFCIFLLFFSTSMVKKRNVACRTHMLWICTNMSIVTHGLYRPTVSKCNRPSWLEFRCYWWEEPYGIPLHLLPISSRGSKTTP